MKMQPQISILGAAKSGIGAAALAKKVGLEVFVSDYGTIKQEYKTQLEELGVQWEENGHSKDIILGSKEVIKSPGIADDVPIVKDLIASQVPVISEIEFAGRYSKGKKICITGSNGKTTTTLMLEHILSKAGLDVVAVGNVGNSFAQVLSEADHDFYVIELSSFQLDNMHDFKADIAILLNITPDHLDRYNNDFQNYVDSKFRISNNQNANQFLIYNADDPVINKEILKRNISSTLLPFSIEKALPKGASLDNNNIQINIKTKQTIMSIHELAQQGKHNTYNSMASGIASRVLDIRKEIIRESLSDFQNVEHRLEFVAKIHGIDFINDSKATNVNSTWYALESMQKPTIWIVGGVDKGNDYTMLEGLVKQKVVGIVCLGKSNRKIHRSFNGVVDNIHDSSSAAEAVRISYQLAKKGYSVLLSPACASFDLFENYEERGTKFKRAVRAL